MLRKRLAVERLEQDLVENDIGVTLPTPQFGSHKLPQQWGNQLAQRGWTSELIDEAIASGRGYPAPNYS